MKKAIFIVGPAGSGKTTLCEALQDYLLTMDNPPHYVNLDPASNIPTSDNNNCWDIREKYTLENVMRLYQLGPNGALLRILELFGKDITYLEEKLQPFDADFLLVDCPGQIEAYIHQEGGINSVISAFKQFGYETVVLFTLDSTFISNQRKMLLGAMISLVSMLHLDSQLLVIVTKMDILGGVEEWDSLQEKLEASLQDYDDDDESFLSKVYNIIDKFGFSEMLPVDVTDSESIALLHGKLSILFNEEDEQENSNGDGVDGVDGVDD